MVGLGLGGRVTRLGLGGRVRARLGLGGRLMGPGLGLLGHPRLVPGIPSRTTLKEVSHA